MNRRCPNDIKLDKFLGRNCQKGPKVGTGDLRFYLLVKFATHENTNLWLNDNYHFIKASLQQGSCYTLQNIWWMGQLLDALNARQKKQTNKQTKTKTNRKQNKTEVYILKTRKKVRCIALCAWWSDRPNFVRILTNKMVTKTANWKLVLLCSNRSLKTHSKKACFRSTLPTYVSSGLVRHDSIAGRSWHMQVMLFKIVGTCFCRINSAPTSESVLLLKIRESSRVHQWELERQFSLHVEHTQYLLVHG